MASAHGTGTVPIVSTHCRSVLTSRRDGTVDGRTATALYHVVNFELMAPSTPTPTSQTPAHHSTEQLERH